MGRPMKTGCWRNPPLLRERIDRVVEKHENLRLNFAPVAQLDRVPGYEPGGRRFESFRARHIKGARQLLGLFVCVEGR